MSDSEGSGSGSDSGSGSGSDSDNEDKQKKVRSASEKSSKSGSGSGSGSDSDSDSGSGSDSDNDALPQKGGPPVPPGGAGPPPPPGGGPPPPPGGGPPPPPGGGGPPLPPGSEPVDQAAAAAAANNKETALVPSGELPELEPALSNIQPIPIKKTLMIVNNFIVNTTEFMNKFSVLCERKLYKVSQSTNRLDIILAILEAKLDSIPWLKDPNAAPPASSAPASSSSGGGAEAGGGGGPPPPPGAPGAPTSAGGGPPPAPGAAPVAAVEAAPAAPVGPLLKNDPTYGKFFKMLGMGVPKQALRMKMTAEGVDPDVIDMDPEQPMGAAPSDPNMAPVDFGSDGEEEEVMSDIED